MYNDVLTIPELVALWTVTDAAARTAPVARVIEDTNLRGDAVYGTARSVGDKQGNFLGPRDDVRNGHLRVTLRSGFEVFWPVSTLTEELKQGLFVVDYEAPA